MPFTKENARIYQEKGRITARENNRAFDELGAYILLSGADHYREIMEQRYREGKLDQFQKSYEAMLEYFKPKLARTESTITIKQKLLKLDDTPELEEGKIQN